MPSKPKELRAVSLCAYLTGDLKRRNPDWDAAKIVQAVKGDPIKGYFDLQVSGVQRRFNQANIQEFLGVLPRAMAGAILPRLSGDATLVPIPNSHVTDPRHADFPTLKLAREIADASGGRLVARPALVFREPQQKARKGGPRRPEYCESAYRIVENVDGDIVLVDDVCTTGGHLIGAVWKLADAGMEVVLAATVGHTTHEYVEKPVSVQDYTLSLARPFDDINLDDLDF